MENNPFLDALIEELNDLEELSDKEDEEEEGGNSEAHRTEDVEIEVCQIEEEAVTESATEEERAESRE